MTIYGHDHIWAYELKGPKPRYTSQKPRYNRLKHRKNRQMPKGQISLKRSKGQKVKRSKVIKCKIREIKWQQIK